jgi:hypothetical protein
MAPVTFRLEFFGIGPNGKRSGPDKVTHTCASLDEAIDNAKSMMATTHFAVTGAAVVCLIKDQGGRILREVKAST